MTDRDAEMMLAPCPFCGSKPEVMGSGDGQRGLMIHCIGKDCPNPCVSYYDHESAIRVWNRRQAAALPQEQGAGEVAEGKLVKRPVAFRICPPVTTEQLDKLQFGRVLHERPAPPLPTTNAGGEALRTVIRAMHSYAVMYSHQTVGDDLRTANRQWRVYELAKVSADSGPPTSFVGTFDDKDVAHHLCNELNARAVLAALAPTNATQAEVREDGHEVG